MLAQVTEPEHANQANLADVAKRMGINPRLTGGSKCLDQSHPNAIYCAWVSYVETTLYVKRKSMCFREFLAP